MNNIISISVGSENIYRFINPGVGIGASPSSILGYIGQVREALKDTGLTDIKIGHVDTWGAWVDPITKDLIDICDFIGIDVYPYFEATASNSINNAQNLFFSALNKTKSAMGCKPIWVTETGWPISGSIFNQAVPSIENARIYWKNVGWAIVGSTNTWWYIL